MRILLTEGAGLTSRQVARRLDDLGHEVSAAVSDPICMARFTRHVRALHRVPEFGPDPLAWFDQMLAVALEAGIDMVFPTQEQVTVLSHQLPRLTAAGLTTAVPPFASLRRVQDKLSALRTLTDAGVPHPRPPSCGRWRTFRRGADSPPMSRHRSALAPSGCGGPWTGLN